VFRHSDLPVLTVGPKVARRAPTEITLKNIICATNFSSTSRRGLPYALSLAQEHQARLTLFHVVEQIDERSNQSEAGARQSATTRLKSLLPPGADLWCYPEFVVSIGNPVDEILKAVRSRQADLLVLGIRSGSAMTGHLPAANTYRLVCETTCPVMTVRG
jgi:nucleotide-binding universal stress UspA family protein